MACGAETKAVNGDRGEVRAESHGLCMTIRCLWAVLSILTSLGPLACEKRERDPGAAPRATPEVPSKETRPRTLQAPPLHQTRPHQTKPLTRAPAPDLFKRGQRFTFEMSSHLVPGVPERFSRSALRTQKLHLASFSERSAPWLAVDHHAPRRALSAYFTLSELVNEDVELAPGSHFLTVFELGTGGVEVGERSVTASSVSRVAVIHFSVDVDAATPSESPGCLLFTPELTKNGKQASKEVRFFAVPLASGIDKVEYRAVSGRFESSGEAPPGIEMILESPPAGDVELGARCFSAGEELGLDEQTVTINPEAVEKEATP